MLWQRWQWGLSNVGPAHGGHLQWKKSEGPAAPVGAAPNVTGAVSQSEKNEASRPARDGKPLNVAPPLPQDTCPSHNVLKIFTKHRSTDLQNVAFLALPCIRIRRLNHWRFSPFFPVWQRSHGASMFERCFFRRALCRLSPRVLRKWDFATLLQSEFQQRRRALPTRTAPELWWNTWGSNTRYS